MQGPESKEVTLTFAVALSDPQLCHMQVNWLWMEKTLDNMCVQVYIDRTRESFFTFLSLPSLPECVKIPLTTDLSLETFKIYIYGLERTNTPYFYRVCASGMQELTAIGENDQWKLQLSEHTIAQSHDSAKDQFDMTRTVSLGEIWLNTVSTELLRDILVIMKQDGSEFFWLTHRMSHGSELFWLPKHMSSDKTIKIPKQMMTQGTVAVKVYSLQRTHCSVGLKVYKKAASSVEMDIEWPANEQPPVKMPDMSIEQLKKLEEKAKDFILKKNQGMMRITHVYRNKPATYFDTILDLQDGVMETYRKDYNGDPACSINGTINGLFFSMTIFPDTKEPPYFSYFGSKRLHIPTEVLLDSNTNVYFADFYCHYSNHYVCLVATKKASQTDAFCKSKLLPLDLADNPFVCKTTAPDQMGQREVTDVTPAVHVELFYTEDIDIGSLLKKDPPSAYFSTVTPRGNGKSTKYGIPKNKNCTICVL